MSSELYGIGEITVTGAVVRIDLMSLSVTEKDGQNNSKPAFRQKILMPIETSVCPCAPPYAANCGLNATST